MVAKRHHFVPKCYLESFAIKSDKKKKSDLCVFDAVERKDFTTAPNNVALQTDFNTIDLDGHPPDAFEQAMASVESDIGPALTRITGRSPCTPNGRSTLAPRTSLTKSIRASRPKKLRSY
jgi:hypothetical protein